MRRTLALSTALLAAAVLTACSSGALDANPPAASGEPSPSPSASQAPSASPEPTPERQRFDDVDLAAALVPLPFEAAEPERWGAWSTQSRAEIVPTLDAAVFADAPECAAAVEAFVEHAPEEVVVGGYPYDGELVTGVVVARMASPEAASSAQAAIDAAASTCADVSGVATVELGMVALQPPFEPSAVIDDAGLVAVQLAYDQSFHPSTYVVAAADELLVLATTGADVMGWDERVVTDIETEVGALEAAAPAAP